MRPNCRGRIVIVLDMEKIFTEAQNKSIADYTNNPNMSKEEVLKKLLEIYVNPLQQVQQKLSRKL